MVLLCFWDPLEASREWRMFVATGKWRSVEFLVYYAMVAWAYYLIFGTNAGAWPPDTLSTSCPSSVWSIALAVP